MDASRVFRGETAEMRLQVYGLESRGLRQVVEYGEMARATTTRNDAGIYRALTPYGGRTRHFRDIHVPRGWKALESLGQSWTISPDGRYRVITLGGDSTTGCDIAGTAPQPSSGIRLQLSRLIQLNNSILEFAFIEETFGRSGGGRAAPAPVTLILLVHRDRASREIRSELSIPAGTAGPQARCYYAERILLAPIPMGPRRGRKEFPTPPSPSPRVDIDRRSA